MRRVLVLVPLFLFAAVALAFVFGLNRNPSLIPSVLIDRPLPSFDLPAVRALLAQLHERQLDARFHRIEQGRPEGAQRIEGAFWRRRFFH